MDKYIIDPLFPSDDGFADWDYCDESEATLFRVWDTGLDVEAAAFATMAQAQAFVAEQAHDPR